MCACIRRKHFCAVIAIIYLSGNIQGNQVESSSKVLEMVPTQAIKYRLKDVQMTTKIVSVIVPPAGDVGALRKEFAAESVSAPSSVEYYLLGNMTQSEKETEIIVSQLCSTAPTQAPISVHQQTISHENLTFMKEVEDNFSESGNSTFPSNLHILQASEPPDLDLRETAGFVAIGFLAFAASGYIGFVLWRRHLVNKYGSNQMLITEDVYDISDLRYFEV